MCVFGLRPILQPGLCLSELRVGLIQLPLRLRELAAHLIQRRLERPWIDLEQELAFPNEAAFGIRLADQIAGHLGFDIGVDEPVQRPDPLRVNRHILLRGRHHLHLQWRRSRWTAGRTRAPRADQKQNSDNEYAGLFHECHLPGSACRNTFVVDAGSSANDADGSQAHDLVRLRNYARRLS